MKRESREEGNVRQLDGEARKEAQKRGSNDIEE